ncbi:MAG: hypothetical protein KAI71_02600 [Candidatus Pacebacteria bacterium]|nr:hypothetical protein [Candidatus Paceibacterota bacterium]
MNTEQLNKYCKKLCEDSIVHFLKDTCSKDISCQMSMRNFILSRRDWTKSDKADDIFVFMDKQFITINMLCYKSTNILINTVICIAKVELIDKSDKDNEENLENNVKEIVKCVEGQDWTIPFIRKRLINKNKEKNKEEGIFPFTDELLNRGSALDRQKKLDREIEKTIKKRNLNKNPIIFELELTEEHYPVLRRRALKSPEMLEKEIKSIANAWHEGDAISAMQALESDLEHSG